MSRRRWRIVSSRIWAAKLETLDLKLIALREIIQRLGSCAVAFSGGVDSTLVLKVARDVLADGVVAVTALSESLPAGELDEAERLAKSIGVEHFVIRTFETADENYLINGANRCYFCKTEMYARLGEFARNRGMAAMLDGLNVDDLSDRRPGRAAAVEHGVISPLVEANLTKTEVRELSRRFDLPTWDKPALACLSSRIPQGTPITLKSLSQVDRAETFLKSLGVGQVRVRHHGDTARIEVERHDFGLLNDHWAEITREYETFGFARVEIEAEGYIAPSDRRVTAPRRTAQSDNQNDSPMRSVPLPVITYRK